MEENKNKQIDAFLKKQLQEIPLDSPSKDFTSRIMDVIDQEESTVTTVYKPLISKRVWIFVAATIAAIFFIPFQETEGSLFNKLSLDLSIIGNLNPSGLLDGVSVSSTVFYGFVFFAIMVVIQVVFLKDYFNKKMTASL